jgi:hypothetical protein
MGIVKKNLRYRISHSFFLCDYLRDSLNLGLSNDGGLAEFEQGYRNLPTQINMKQETKKRTTKT